MGSPCASLFRRVIPFRSSQESSVQGSQQLRAGTHPASSNSKSELLPHQAEGVVDEEKVVTSLKVI